MPAETTEVKTDWVTKLFTTRPVDKSSDLHILKIETVNIADLKFNVVHKFAEKMKWMRRFDKAYTGFLSRDVFARLDMITFVVAVHEQKEVGFLALTDTTSAFDKYTKCLSYDISIGYVKPAYQSQGILQAMIENSVANHHAVSITIAQERFEEHSAYYLNLGFVVSAYIQDARCFRLYLKRWEPFLSCVSPKELWGETEHLHGISQPKF